MIIEKLEVSSFLMNCYILGCEKTKQCAIIDPGGSPDYIIQRIQELGLEPMMILLTHAHADHMSAVPQLKEKYNIPLYVHEADVEFLKNPDLNFSYDLFRKEISIDCDKIMHNGDTIKLGEIDIFVIHTPGHTPGGVCFKVGDVMFVGDTIFNHSVGRTDLIGGSSEALIDSIVKKVLIYDDEVKLYPGHMGPTSIGVEKRENMFVRRYFK